MGFSGVGRNFLANTLETTGWGSWRRASARLGVLILNYHRIGTHVDSPFDWGLWSATEEGFDSQLRFLKSEFDIIAPTELEDALKHRERNCILITFDDGYRDNWAAAYPILRSHEVPATFFLSTGFLDHPKISWWDDIAWMVRHATREVIPSSFWIEGETHIQSQNPQKTIRELLSVYKSLPGDETGRFIDFLAESTGSGRCPGFQCEDMWMTWDMVREMRAGGMHFGGHTVHHPILARISPTAQEFEIRESCARISQELGEPTTLFSYPVGGPTAYDSSTQAILKKNGIRWAFTYGFGHRASERDFPYEIPRIPVEADFSLLHFRAMTTWPRLFC